MWWFTATAQRRVNVKPRRLTSRAEPNRTEPSQTPKVAGLLAQVSSCHNSCCPLRLITVSRAPRGNERNAALLFHLLSGRFVINSVVISDRRTYHCLMSHKAALGLQTNSWISPFSLSPVTHSSDARGAFWEVSFTTPSFQLRPPARRTTLPTIQLASLLLVYVLSLNQL